MAHGDIFRKALSNVAVRETKTKTIVRERYLTIEEIEDFLIDFVTTTDKCEARHVEITWEESCGCVKGVFIKNTLEEIAIFKE